MPPAQGAPTPPALRLRRTLSNPKDHGSVFHPTARVSKRSLTPVATFVPAASAPVPESVSRTELWDRGSGIFEVQITTERPGARTPELLAEMARCFSELKDRKDAKVVLLSGCPSLVAGAESGPVAGQFAPACAALADCELPVIAALEGDTLGPAWLLSSLCDFIICSQSAHYGFDLRSAGFPACWVAGFQTGMPCDGPKARPISSGLPAGKPVPRGLDASPDYSSRAGEPGVQSGPGSLSLDAALVELRPFLRERFGPDLGEKFLNTPSSLAGAELAHASIPVVPGHEVHRRALELGRELARFPRQSLALLKGHLSRRLFTPQAPPVPNPEPDWEGNDAAISAIYAAAVTDSSNTPEGVDSNCPGQPVEVPSPSGVVRLLAYPDGVLLAVLSDRATRNAFSAELTQGIQELFQHIQAHPEYKAVVLTGYDRHFASGGTKQGLLSIHRGTARYSDAPLYELPLRCEIPVMAALQGHAMGAGWSFGMFCDHVILAEDGLYSSRFMRYGFTPGFGSTLVFIDRFGYDLGREILFAARDYSGQDLKQRGARMPVVPSPEVLPSALRLAHRLAAFPRQDLVRCKQRRARPWFERLPGIVQAELAMHDRTLVGNSEALKGIEFHFGAPHGQPETPSEAPSPPAPAGSDGDRLSASLRDSLAEELRLAPHEIELDAPFTDLGLDSITGVSWVRRLNKRFGLTLSANEIYQAPTLGEFTQLVRDQLARAGGHPQVSTTTPPPSSLAPVRHPLSEGQKGLWLLQRIDPGMAAYNVPVAFRIKEPDWAAVLENTIAALLARHPLLGVVIGMDEQGQPCQYLPAVSPVRMQRESIDSLSSETGLARLKTVFKTPFRLEEDALMRVHWFTDAQGRQAVLFTLHHILFDGTSLAIFVRDLLDIWSRMVRQPVPGRGQEREASSIPTQPVFFDFLKEEQAYLQGEEGQKDLAYWKERLGGEPIVSEYPPDRVRPARRTYSGATVSSRLPARLSERLRDLARQKRTSLFTLLLAIYKILLSRYARQDTVVVGVPVAGRPGECYKEEIGYFINMIALRSSLDQTDSFTTFLERVKWTVLKGLEHSRYPFARLVSELRLEPTPLHSPVFQTVFVLQNFVPHGGFLGSNPGSLGVELLPGLHQEGEYDLRCEMIDLDSSLEVSVSYDTDVFCPETIQRIIQHYGNLAEAIVEDPGKNLGDYTVLSEAERYQVEQAWNQTARPYPQEECLHHVLERRVDFHPEAPALLFENGQWTVREVQERVFSLAASLQARGLRPDDRVALCLRRSPEMVMGVLGVLQAGAAYVPIDPSCPADRIAYLLADSGARLILTDESSAGRISEASRGAIPLIRLDADWKRIQSEGTGRVLSRVVTPSHLAYVIYTSGSTGQPKGVMVEHRQALNTLRHLQEAYPVGKSDTYLLKTNYTFDVSVAELFGWLMGSGRLAILPEGTERLPDQIAQAIHAWKVTHINFVPSALGVFLHHLQSAAATSSLDSLKYVMVAGEAFPEEMVAEAVRAFPSARVENIYGPTETAIYACALSCGSHSPPGVHTSIGRPIANTQLYVLGPGRRSAGLGVPGELAIGGLGVARGYLNRPELTAQSFVDHPFQPGARLFLTGDLVRWLPSGQIEFFGRIDHQLKIRGFRVEPGEVEALLNRHPGIQSSVVVATGQGAARQLAACYVPRPGQEALESQVLVGYLADLLPDYMVPQFYIPVEAFPLTSSGKVDRRALSMREFRHTVQGAKVIPQGRIEDRLAAIWKDLLQLESVGATDRFFEVGGNSLLAVLLADRVSREFKCSFPASAVFKCSSIQAIARQVGPAEVACLAPEETSIAPPPRDQLVLPSSNILGEPNSQSCGCPAASRAVIRQTAQEEPGICRNAAEKDQAGPPSGFEDSLAIIGMSCCFPGAADLDQFWAMLREGRAGGRFLTQEELLQQGVPENLVHDPKFVPLRLAVEEKDAFDAEFFNIPARNACLMDPQFRQLLMHAWKAVEDAGYAPGQIPETSVFMSAGQSFYQRALDQAGLVEPSDAYSSWVLSQGGTIPAMISYTLGFTGPSLFVHSNCSSSLAGLHLAWQSLRSGEAKYALVGAATLFYPTRDGYLHRPGLNFSSDGRCKVFDAAADGMVGGEGVAVILLKRAREALADGDAIYALVRGVAMNNDGWEKAGFYAPGARGQASVIDSVLRSTRINPETINYVEAHGTGTHLGDPVEVLALTEAYRRYTPRTRFCGIGSVKSNIGHADTAAGLAGCIKLALSLRHRLLAPSIHYQMPNPAIDFTTSPFYVADQLAPWPEGPTPRRAALSSFGIGGSNVHAILEECVSRRGPAPLPAGPFLIPLSARNSQRLGEMIANLLHFLESREGLDLAAVAYTLSVGRQPMESRAAFLVLDQADLQLKLKRALTLDSPGDGCWIGANQPKDDLLSPDDIQPIAARWKSEGRLDKLAQLWVRGLPLNWALLFDKQPGRRIHLPTYPFAKDRYSVSPMDSVALRATPLMPSGHPLLGENTSTLREWSFSTVLTGREFFLSDHLVQGRKLLPAAALLETAYAAIAKIAEMPQPGRLRLRDVLWLRPFHVDAEPRGLRTLLHPASPDRIEIEIRALTTAGQPEIHCQGTALLAAEPAPAPLEISELKSRMVDRCWTSGECYQVFAQAGFQYGGAFQAVREVFIRNHQALARLELPAMLSGAQDAFTLHPSLVDAAFQACVILSLRASVTAPGGSSPLPARGVPFSVQSVEIFRPCPTRAWAWIRALEEGRSGDRLRKFDIDLCDEQGNVCVQFHGYSTRALDQPTPVSPAPRTVYARPVWSPKSATPEIPLPEGAERLVWTCGVSPMGCSTFAKRHFELPAGPANLGPWFMEVSGQIFQAVKEALQKKIPGLFQLVIPARGPESCLEAIAGLFRVAHLENPRFFGQVIQVASDVPAFEIPGKLDLDGRCPSDFLIRHAGSQRLVPSWAEVEAASVAAGHPWKEDGIYVITGGAGGLGRIFAREIISRTRNATVILAGRSGVSISQLEAWGLPPDRVSYHAVDLSRGEQVEAFIGQIKADHPAVDGILHAAGITRDNFILRKSLDEFQRVLAPKVLGAAHLNQAARALQPAFLAFFSSGAAWFASPGQADYAVANAFLGSLAGLSQEDSQNSRIIAIDWPLWKEGGMQADPARLNALQKAGFAPLESNRGIAAFSTALASGQNRCLVLEGETTRLKAILEAKPDREITVPSRVQPSLVGSDLRLQTEEWVRRIISEIAKCPPAKLAADVPFEKYGIDSILQITIIEKLQEVTGALAKTLLFEYPTLGELAGCLARENSESLRRYFQGAAEEEVTDTIAESRGGDGSSPAGSSPTTRCGDELSPPQSQGPMLRLHPAENDTLGSDEIAIIGLSGRYPMADSLESFWNNLKTGRNCVTQADSRRWPQTLSPRQPLPFYGGFLNKIDRFDHALFGVPPEQVMTLSPETRLFLEIAWETFEDAGYARPALKQLQQNSGCGVGVFVGIMYYQYPWTFPSLEQAILGSNSTEWHVANRVSHFFDLTGPSLALNSACSSSLLAIHLACESLKQRGCSMALAGGVNLTLHPSKFEFLQSVKLLENGPSSRGFGVGSGYVPGEGVGAVLLKPLRAALRDGDRVQGVIKASFTSHAGGRQAYTAPDPNQQAHLISECIRRSGLHPGTIGYIESAVNGSPLGDPIEVLALKKAFKPLVARQACCGLGSVKSNIGHLEAASGMAQLSKVLLQMKHRTLAPSIHSHPRNPSIQLQGSPFFIPEESMPWRAPVDPATGRDCPRRSLINSIGAGGACVSLLVEEFLPSLPAQASADDLTSTQLLVLSAATRSSLLASAQQWSVFLEQNPSITLQDVARALYGREALAGFRAALVAHSLDDAIQKLRQLAASGVGDDASEIYLSPEPCADRDLPPLAVDGNTPVALAAHWLAGGNLEIDPGRPVAGNPLPIFPKYAFDHSRSFANGSLPDSKPAGRAVFRRNEPLLRDHTLGGKQVLIGVAHASLAIEAYFMRCPDARAVGLRQLAFIQPIEIGPSQQAEVEVVEDAASGPEAFRARFKLSVEAAWRDTAKGRLQLSDHPFGRQDLNALKEACPSILDPRGIYEAGEPYFQVGPFFRVIRQLLCGRGVALAQVDLTEALQSQPRAWSLHPLLTYSAFGALVPLLKSAGFNYAFLPFGIKNLEFRKCDGLEQAWIVTRLVKNTGEMVFFDADILTAGGEEVALYRGCSIKRLRLEPQPDSAHPVPVSPAVQSLASEEEGIQAVRQYLLDALGRPAASTRLDANLIELGLTSSQLVGLADKISSEKEILLDPTLFFEYPTLRELIRYFVENHRARFLPFQRSMPVLAQGNPAPMVVPPQAGGFAGQESSPPRSEPEEICPLSEGQKGLWALQKAAPEMAAYNCPLCFRVGEPLDIPAFREACRFLLVQHPLLAARVEERDGIPVFVPGLTSAFQVRQIDARDWSESRVQAWIKESVKTPFDLEKDSLLRASLLALSGQDTIVLFTVHHVVFDGSSFALFMKALLEAYGAIRMGRQPELTSATASYRDYVLAERACLEGGEGAKRLAYWKEQLSGERLPLELPLDYPRSSSQPFAGRTVSCLMTPDLAWKLKTFANTHALFPSSLFLAVYQELLHLCSGQSDITVGMPVNGRMEERFQSIIGYFVNMAPVRSQRMGKQPFLELVRQVQKTMLAALAHRYPFPALVRELKCSGQGYHPIFQAAFEYQNFLRPGEAEAVQEAIESAFPMTWMEDLHQEGEYELALEVIEQAENYQLNLKFNPTLLRESTASRLLARLNLLLESALANPRRIPAPELLLSSSERRLLEQWNETRCDYRKEACIHHFFEEQARRSPDSVAAVFEDEALTYRELEKRSAQLAIRLQGLGVQPGALVGLCLERSLEMIIAILGILKAGGAYMPLDPDYPAERLAFMVRDSQAVLILSHSSLADRVAPLKNSSTRVRYLDRSWKSSVGATKRKPSLKRMVQAQDLAYVLYTSGSTGTPKGVMIEHRALCNRIVWMQREYQLQPGDRVLQKTPFSFDVSGWEFHWPLLAGACLVFAAPGKHKDPEYLHQIIQAQSITVLHFVPSMLQAFLALDDAPPGPSLRHVFCSGEELTPAMVGRFHERFDRPMLHNLYGPTEAAIDVSFKSCQPQASIVTIGKPISNMRFYVVDQELRLLPVGLPGELCLAGDGLARGYLNRPDLTAERFMANPFEPGARLYRTGDRARWTADGEIEFLGRIDHQVKIRGCRIELGEIEAVLAGLAGIRQAVVVPMQQGDGQELAAYYAAQSGIDPQWLRRQLRQQLPEHMIPSTFIPLENLPLTSSGKVDRRVLSQPPRPSLSSQAGHPPLTPIQARLQALWCEALSLKSIGLHESFFDLGGHSLSALSLMTRLNSALGVRLPLATLFEAKSIAELARRLEADETTVANPYLAALESSGSRPPLYLVPGLGGGSASFLPLSRALRPDYPVYLFQPPGLLGERESLDSVPDLAAFYLSQLPPQPGPAGYCLGGWSMGGVVAYEMACQLMERGIPVDRLILIDSYLAEHFEAFSRIVGTTVAVPDLSSFHFPIGAANGQPAAHGPAAKVLEAHQRALASYRPVKIYPGEVLFFWAADHSLFPSNGPIRTEVQPGNNAFLEDTREIWKKYLPRIGARFISVPGDHHSILRDPAVNRVAIEIRALCDHLGAKQS